MLARLPLEPVLGHLDGLQEIADARDDGLGLVGSSPDEWARDAESAGQTHGVAGRPKADRMTDAGRIWILSGIPAASTPMCLA